MLACLVLNITMIVPIGIGVLLFSFLALKRGWKMRDVARMALSGTEESMIVISVMILIGCLTGLWRISGTISYFLTLGISAIPPGMFILSAFLLSSLMSYAIGTSFGVTATAGVVLISIARAGNVNLLLAGGAIISGVYVGDRGSPAASSASLMAALTKTDLTVNIRKMLKTGFWPFVISCAFAYV